MIYSGNMDRAFSQIIPVCASNVEPAETRSSQDYECHLRTSRKEMFVIDDIYERGRSTSRLLTKKYRKVSVSTGNRRKFLRMVM